jgi:hypothetical protein
MEPAGRCLLKHRDVAAGRGDLESAPAKVGKQEAKSAIGPRAVVSLRPITSNRYAQAVDRLFLGLQRETPFTEPA